MKAGLDHGRWPAWLAAPGHMGFCNFITEYL